MSDGTSNRIKYLVFVDCRREEGQNALDDFIEKVKSEVSKHPSSETSNAQHIGLVVHKKAFPKHKWELRIITKSLAEAICIPLRNNIREIKKYIKNNSDNKKLHSYRVDFEPHGFLVSVASFMEGVAEFKELAVDDIIQLRKPESIVTALSVLWNAQRPNPNTRIISIQDKGGALNPISPLHQELPAGVWKVVGESQIGWSHKEEARPNQDAFQQYTPDNNALYPIIVSVADGHGGARYCRSDRGSLFAVKAVAKAWKQVEAEMPNLKPLAECKRLIEQRLPQWIVKTWRESVDTDLLDKPFTEKEHLLVKGNPYNAYGSTLVTAIITEEFTAFLQIGDGDTLVLNDDLTLWCPLPQDVRNDGVATTSLCQSDAGNLFRVEFLFHTSNLPVLIMLSTDGYSNSYGGRVADFQKASKDYYELLRERGVEYVQQRLPLWLGETTEKGSGDDITVALLYRDRSESKVNFNKKREV